MNPTINLLSSICNPRAPEAPLLQEYNLPPSERARETNVEQLIDFPSIHFAPPQYDLYDRPRHVNQIIAACLGYGMFEVVNHEVSEDVMNNVLRSSASFFDSGNLSLFSNETSMLYSGCAAKAAGLERESYWRDTLTLSYNTGNPTEGWPITQPLRRDLWQFATEVTLLESRLLSVISQGLGLAQSYFNYGLTGSSSICVNHHPQCKYPTKTLGFPKHGEPNLITISLQGDVPGLQIFTNGQWKSVVTSRNSLLVTVGYQMEVLSNGQIKAPQQRVLVKRRTARTTVSFKTAPFDDYIVEPAREIAGPENCLYKRFVYRDFLSCYNANKKDADTILPYILL